jgi:hypothetical protein
VAGEHDRQHAAALDDHLHQPLEPVQRLAMKVVGFIDKQRDRL